MPSVRPIYLDYHSTTPCDRRVAALVLDYMTEKFGNPSSIDHSYGDVADVAVKQASQNIAELIQAKPREIIFTSGATESINLVLRGLPTSYPQKIAIMPVEHKAVLDTCAALEQKGLAEIVILPVDDRGRLDLETVEKACSQGLSLLCVMAANNEIGNIYPVEAIAKIAQRYTIPFLCDASQAVGKILINFSDWGISYLAISGHKLYAPKGIGALVIRKGLQLQPLLYGGGQQQKLRPGTLNVPGIVGLGETCRLRQLEMEDDEKLIAQKRDHLQTLLQQNIPNLVINGDLENRLAGNLHISIPGIPNKAIIARIRHQLSISTGSACTSGVESPSHVLRAIALPTSYQEAALRIGIGKFTTNTEINQAANILNQVVKDITKSV